MKDPARSYTNGLIITVLIVMLVYLLPIAAGVCVLPWREWDVGAFKDAAATKGYWLEVWIAIAAFAGCLGSFNSLLYCDALALKCMAGLRWIPSCFAYLAPRVNTPVVGITLTAAAAGVLGIFDFEYVVQMETPSRCFLSSRRVSCCATVNQRSLDRT